MIDVCLALLVFQQCRAVEGGLPSDIAVRMLLNIIFDFVIGLIPILGDLADAVVRALSLRFRGREALTPDRSTAATRATSCSWRSTCVGSTGRRMRRRASRPGWRCLRMIRKSDCGRRTRARLTVCCCRDHPHYAERQGEKTATGAHGAVPA